PMDAQTLGKLFGKQQEWQGPCTVIVDAAASIALTGIDSLQGGGQKSYAPRTVSGRIPADSACLLSGGTTLLVLQDHRSRTATGEDSFRQGLLVIDTSRVVGVEFGDGTPVLGLGIAPAPQRGKGSSAMLTRPKLT